LFDTVEGNVSVQKNTLKWIEQVSTYLPLIGTAVVLILSTFVEGVLKSIPIAILLAIMATSFVLTAVHLETNLQELRKEVSDMKNKVSGLEATQASYLDALIPETRVMTLAEGFRVGIDKIQRVGHLRIFAISSQQILSFLRFHAFQVERCSILLRSFPEDDAGHADFASQIRLVVKDWYNMKRDGRIANLRIRSYDFFPTEYECIFDSTLMMLGLYDSDPRDYSEVRVRGITLFDGATEPGRNVIREYIERFDTLFEICAQHHGPNVYDSIATNNDQFPSS
jgi:hypothetical protein